jgi:prophage antirepressor-like protein
MSNANQNVSLFDFNGHNVRVVEIAGEPWFVARDVCAALDMELGSGTRQWTRYLSNDDKRLVTRGELPVARTRQP